MSTLLSLLLCLTVVQGSLQQESKPSIPQEQVVETTIPPCNASITEKFKSLVMRRVGDKYYYFSNPENAQHLNWTAALQFCRSHGLELASIETESEHHLLGHYMLKNYAWQYFWLGGTDEPHEGVWKWSTGQNFTFTSWEIGEPDNLNGDAHCLETWPFEGKYNWSDMPCLTRNRFICELNEPCEPVS